jgi:hypothetical protein
MPDQHFASDSDHLRAHRHSLGNRSEIEKSTTCGCFYCLTTFTPGEIKEWIDENQTALCPKCEVDSVIGSASGFPSNGDFLLRVHDHWF